MATNPQRAPWWKRIKIKMLEITGNLDMTGHRITNLGDGQSGSQDGCSVAQMEAANQNLIVDDVDAATTAALPANTRTADVLTAGANGAFPTVDGIAPVLNYEYLVKDEGGIAAHINNGIYKLTQLGDGGTPWKLTRRSDMNNGKDAAHVYVSVDNGTANGGKSFRCINNAGSGIVNTDALEWKFWGLSTDHANLSNLAWNAAKHIIDVDVDMAGYKIKNCRHIGVYHVSDVFGSDGVDADGDEDNPFQTAQAAFNYGVSMLDSVIILIIDSNTMTPYLLNIPNYSPPTSICSVEAMMMAWDTFSSITVGAGNRVAIDNLSVLKLKEGTNSNLTTILIEECYIKTLLNNAETGHPANWKMTFAETLMDTTAITNVLAMGARARGKTLDNQTDKSYNLTELSMNGHKITDGADPTLAQDFATKNYVDSIGKPKAGNILAASFAGNPKVATVTFNTTFPNANYSVSIIGADGRIWTVQNQIAGSFIIDSGSNVVLTGDVHWIATPHNDP